MNPLRRSSCSRALAPLAVTVAVALSFFPPALRAAAPLNLGSRWELFVDEFLVASQKDVALKLHEPVRREIVLATDQPWEGPTSAYFSVIQDGRKVRLYYRGSATVSDHSVEQFTCVAESEDGIHFTRPRVGLIDFAGSKENNIVWRGVESHNFAAFLATSATGSVRIELQDESGRPLPGFALADMPELFGDEFDAVVKWKTGTDLAALRGKTIRLRVQLKDADL